MLGRNDSAKLPKVLIELREGQFVQSLRKLPPRVIGRILLDRLPRYFVQIVEHFGSARLAQESQKST